MLMTMSFYFMGLEMVRFTTLKPGLKAKKYASTFIHHAHNCCFTILKISHIKNYQVESWTRSLSLRRFATLSKVMQSN